MQHLRIRDLLDLAVADFAEPEHQVQQVYQWHFEHSMTIAKLLMGAGVSLVIAIMVGLFKEEISIPLWETAIVLVAAAILVGFGIFRLWILRRIHREYISGLYLLQELKSLVPFVKRYRASNMEQL